MQNHYTDWLYYFLFCLIDKIKICCILIKIAITKSFGFLINLDLSENMKEEKKKRLFWARQLKRICFPHERCLILIKDLPEEGL